MIQRVLRFLLPALIPVFFISSCVVQQNPISGKKRAYGYTWEEEKQLGKKADKQIQQQYGLYDDPDLVNYVEELGQEVLSASHMRRDDTPAKYKNTEFHFRVLDSEVVNAFALPGGYVYVTRGLLSHLNNEAQLAVVLGHEIGHVAARHASQRAFEQKIGSIALLGGAIAGQELLGLPGQDLLNLGSTATQLLFLQYSRDDERESDKLGVEYAARLNYEASEGADFFTTLKRISDKSGQEIPSFLSTHPEPGEREKTIPSLAEAWKERGYELTTVNKQGYMDAIDNMIYGSNPRQGFTRDDTFYHPDLKFQFPVPGDWKVINQASQVIVANKEGNAVTVMTLDSESTTPAESVSGFTAQEGIAVVESGSADSGGLPAYEATASATTQDGIELGIYVYAVKYQENVYRFLSYTTADRFNSLKPLFISTTNGFRALTDQRILNIEPARLSIIRTESRGTLADFIPPELPFEITPEELAIVNQVYMENSLEEGTYLKVPRQ